jgi:hypothetical protein
MMIASLGSGEASAVFACLRRFMQHHYFELFQEFAPPWICRIRRFTFLPHVLSGPAHSLPWRSLSFDDIASGLDLIATSCFPSP